MKEKKTFAVCGWLSMSHYIKVAKKSQKFQFHTDAEVLTSHINNTWDHNALELVWLSQGYKLPL